jgi:hypothetical protein
MNITIYDWEVCHERGRGLDVGELVEAVLCRR